MKMNFYKYILYFFLKSKMSFSELTDTYFYYICVCGNKETHGALDAGRPARKQGPQSYNRKDLNSAHRQTESGAGSPRPCESLSLGTISISPGCLSGEPIHSRPRFLPTEDFETLSLGGLKSLGVVICYTK